MTEETPLNDLKVAELRVLAEQHGIDLGAAKSKADIVATIEASGQVPTLTGTYRVTVARLNVRAEPSRTAPVQTVVDHGTQLHAIGEQDTDGEHWTKVDGGWVLTEHLDQVGEE